MKAVGILLLGGAKTRPKKKMEATREKSELRMIPCSSRDESVDEEGSEGVELELI